MLLEPGEECCQKRKSRPRFWSEELFPVLRPRSQKERCGKGHLGAEVERSPVCEGLGWRWKC